MEESTLSACQSSFCWTDEQEEVAAAVAAATAASVAGVGDNNNNKRKKSDSGVDHASYAPMDPAALSSSAHEFNHFLFKMIAFKAERGNYQIPKEEYPELHQWLQTLKREYKNFTMDPNTSHLTGEQLKVLEFLHIPVTSRGDDHWNRFYGKCKYCFHRGQTCSMNTD